MKLLSVLQPSSGLWLFLRMIMESFLQQEINTRHQNDNVRSGCFFIGFGRGTFPNDWKWRWKEGGTVRNSINVTGNSRFLFHRERAWQAVIRSHMPASLYASRSHSHKCALISEEVGNTLYRCGQCQRLTKLGYESKWPLSHPEVGIRRWAEACLSVLWRFLLSGNIISESGSCNRYHTWLLFVL